MRTPFSRISLDFPLSVIASLYAELLTIFPAISAHHISRRMKGKPNKDFPSSSRESRGKVEGKSLYCLPFFLCETLPAEMYGKPMINLCIDANSYKQGKPREIHVKRVHNICISHQFPQEGKSLMPVVHYGHKGFSYLRKLMGNESVEAHFSRISLNFSCSYE